MTRNIVLETVLKTGKLFVGSRIKVTQVNTKNILSRFEAHVLRVEKSGYHGFIELRLDKDVPAMYGLLDERIIHFCFSTKIYRGIIDNTINSNHIFKIEIVGMEYLQHCELLERFGVSIAGHDIRTIMFKHLWEAFSAPVTYGPQGKHVMDTIGGELIAIAEEFLKDNRFSISDRERYIIEKYLYGQKLFPNIGTQSAS